MTQEIVFRSDMKVEKVDHLGTDLRVARAARVSTGLDQEEIPRGTRGLINYLMKHRHGSPFEHASMTFRVEVPIFVAREVFRTRMASYNETSARYRQLEPHFYVYPEGRPLVQAGSGAHPELVQGDAYLSQVVDDGVRLISIVAWGQYRNMIENGAALEVARAVLPVNVYTSFYMTVNLRSLMHFLSLRIDHESNTYETKPQVEIQWMAEEMEEMFAEQFPIVHKAFCKNGRVAP